MVLFLTIYVLRSGLQMRVGTLRISNYGEHTLFETPLILNTIQVGKEPIIDLLIEHFKALQSIQEAKCSFLEYQEIQKSSISFFMEMKNKAQDVFCFLKTLQILNSIRDRNRLKSKNIMSKCFVNYILNYSIR